MIPCPLSEYGPSTASLYKLLGEESVSRVLDDRLPNEHALGLSSANSTRAL